jgi:hypothetical protein
MNPQYVWVVTTAAFTATFSWSNVAKKYLRDTYTLDGELHLPPRDRIMLQRFKLNPKAGKTLDPEYLDVEEFLAA